MTASDTPTAADLRLVICGLGGQGIVFLSRVIATAALLDGEDVLTAETHGMSQRGGAVEAHLKLGGYASSLVRRGRANAVLVLDPTRIDAGLAALMPDGACFANASQVAPLPAVAQVDATAVASDLGFSRGGNLVLLGFACTRAPGLFPSATAILGALDRLSPPVARDDNRRAFERGGELA